MAHLVSGMPYRMAATIIAQRLAPYGYVRDDARGGWKRMGPAGEQPAACPLLDR